MTKSEKALIVLGYLFQGNHDSDIDVRHIKTIELLEIRKRMHQS